MQCGENGLLDDRRGHSMGHVNEIHAEVVTSVRQRILQGIPILEYIKGGSDKAVGIDPKEICAGRWMVDLGTLCIGRGFAKGDGKQRMRGCIRGRYPARRDDLLRRLKRHALSFRHCLQIGGAHRIDLRCRDNFSVSIDDDGRWSGLHSIPCEHRARRIDANPTRHLLLGQKSLHSLQVFVVDGNELKFRGIERLHKLIEMRKARHARRAPCGPELQHHNLPLQACPVSPRARRSLQQL